MILGRIKTSESYEMDGTVLRSQNPTVYCFNFSETGQEGQNQATLLCVVRLEKYSFQEGGEFGEEVALSNI